MRWPWRRRGHNGDARARAEQEAKLRSAQRQDEAGLFEYIARSLADLPDDEFAELVAQAFRRRA